MLNKPLALLLFICFSVSATFAQRTDTIIRENDTILRFYYDSVNVSSEGPIVNGIPDGHWKNFYTDGNLKSEGNRVNGLKNGSFKFYDRNYNLTLLINYKDDLKHGVRITFLKDEFREELFKNDLKEGFSRYFTRKDSTLIKIIPYKNDLPHGISRIYSKNGMINEIIEYKKGRIVSIQYVNRFDKQGRKQGKWVQFWPYGKLKSEGYFLNNQKHGFFKYYSNDGNLLKVEKYQNGYLLKRAPEVVSLDQRISYYDNGNIKTIGHYIDSLPEGIWQEFDSVGEVKETYVFKDGIISAKGIIDKNGYKQGDWNEYYPDQRLLGKGQFKNGYRYGKWTFYHLNGNVEQTGYYNEKGQLDKEWVWFYESGKLLRKENYKSGKLFGEMLELYEDGDTIVYGEFFENLETGYWILRYGDFYEEGEFLDGNKEGMWNSYYKNGQLYFEGKYLDGNPDGLHTWYWPNGKVKLQGFYNGYQKDGEWIRYNDSGFPEISITYTAGKEVKFEGIDVKLD